MREIQALLPTRHGGAPVLLQVPSGFPALVLLYHGLGACKETQRAEAESLARAGFLVATVDAWGHGARRLERFEERVDGPEFKLWFARMLAGSVQEIPDIVDALLGLTGPLPVAVAGISMGGCIAFGAPLYDSRVTAIVPILGSPDWGLGQDLPEEAGPNPLHHPDEVTRAAVLAFNAGKDENVPPDKARTFLSGRGEYHEYAESTHFMREEDWHDLWRRTLEWLERWSARI
ncbi:MAG TPA: alpha/beta fold hydrolase [Candidatus Xenobia bacterium]|jgi:alpha-beta hydrolase superfamily lysophospholipase